MGRVTFFKNRSNNVLAQEWCVSTCLMDLKLYLVFFSHCDIWIWTCNPHMYDSMWLFGVHLNLIIVTSPSFSFASCRLALDSHPIPALYKTSLGSRVRAFGAADSAFQCRCSLRHAGLVAAARAPAPGGQQLDRSFLHRNGHGGTIKHILLCSNAHLIWYFFPKKELHYNMLQLQRQRWHVSMILQYDGLLTTETHNYLNLAQQSV